MQNAGMIYGYPRVLPNAGPHIGNPTELFARHSWPGPLNLFSGPGLCLETMSGFLLFGIRSRFIILARSDRGYGYSRARKQRAQNAGAAVPAWKPRPACRVAEQAHPPGRADHGRGLG